MSGHDRGDPLGRDQLAGRIDAHTERAYAQAGTHALGDACEERFPIADAARAAAPEVPFSTGSSRRLVGEGGSRKSRMGRPDGRPGDVDRPPSEEVGPRRSLVQVNPSYRERVRSTAVEPSAA